MINLLVRDKSYNLYKYSKKNYVSRSMNVLYRYKGN